MKSSLTIIVILFLLNLFPFKAQCQNDSLSIAENNYQWISYRMKLNVEKEGASNSFQVFFVNRIDSIIYLNFNVSGIEIIRVVMTPEKVTYVNKMENNYFISDYTQFSTILGLNLDFYMVQSIFNAADFKYFENNFKVFDNEAERHLVSEKRCNILNDKCLSQEIMLDSGDRIIGNVFSDFNKNTSVRVGYKDYLPVDSSGFFSLLSIEMNHLKMKVTAELKNVKFNVPGPTSIRIPDTFEMIKFP